MKEKLEIQTKIVYYKGKKHVIRIKNSTEREKMFKENIRKLLTEPF